MQAGRRWSWQRSTLGELVAEFLGTMIILLFGDGSVAMVVAGLNQSGRGTKAFVSQADWLIIGWGWALGVMFGVWVAGGVSGAHLNPAVTLAQALRRRFPWRKVAPYMIAQVVGAFVAAAIVYGDFVGAINSLNHAMHITRGAPKSLATYSIFATFPAPYLGSWVTPFLDQVLGTALLVGLIFAVIDEYNAPVKGNLAPLVIGLIVFAIGICFGTDAGYAINPARDLGPRLFAFAAGWGKVAFPGDYGNVNTYFWIPIVGPLVGGAVGCCLYDWLVRDVLIARGAKPEPEVVETSGADTLDVSDSATTPDSGGANA
ncbi:MAG TPA: MIP/aquaporin family protein [Solirubrobacteraceae bacterium]|nr:MIP/aquaporin family protein [Solirubrobacteraceae bacterium]